MWHGPLRAKGLVYAPRGRDVFPRTRAVRVQDGAAFLTWRGRYVGFPAFPIWSHGVAPIAASAFLASAVCTMADFELFNAYYMVGPALLGRCIVS